MSDEEPKGGAKHWELKRQIDVSKVVSGLIDGMTDPEIAKHYKLPTSRVKTIKRLPEVKDQIVSLTEGLKKETLAVYRHNRLKRLHKAFEVLDRHLVEGSLDAVKLVLSGLDKEIVEGGAQQDTAIQIILPPQMQNPAIDVTPKKKGTDEV